MMIGFFRTLTMIALLAQSSLVIGAALTSTVDRNQITMNDTLSLSVKLDQQVDSNALDLAALESDFDVLGISPLNSNSVTINNGKTVQTIYTQWNITLAPKREGNLTIPAFRLAGAQSRVINIAVTSSAVANTGDAPLSVSITSSEVEAFVKQQIILTLEVSAQTNVVKLEGSRFAIENADILDLGQSSGNRIDNGVARQIIQLRYAVFAKQAGELTVPSLTFTGVQGGSRGFFGPRGKRVAARTKSLTLNIKEPPSGNSVWLPSENVTIRSQLSGDPSEYQVGAPITRRITIEAQGQTAEAIPPLSISVQEGSATSQAFKAYEDKPQLETQNSAQGLLGTRIESMAIVPSTAGELILPGFTLNWWDVKADQWRKTSVPSETINVTAPISEENFLNQPKNIELDNMRPTSNSIVKYEKHGYLWQVVSAILLVLCIFQFVLLKRRPKHQELPLINPERRESEYQAWQKLQASLSKGDAVSIRKNTLDWVKLIGPEPRPVTLSSLAQIIGQSTLTEAFAKLESQLYGSKGQILSEKDIKTIQQSLKQWRQNNRKIYLKGHKLEDLKRQKSLKPLYPQ